MRRGLQMALLALAACQSNPAINGQLIGSFTFSGTPVSTDCSFAAVPQLGVDGGFTFEAILSRDPASTKGFMRVGSVERDAGFDGQFFTSQASAGRHFIECGSACDPVPMTETLRLALLSSSQDATLGGRCPANPLDGGVPAALPDGGILAPCPSADSCDVVRACGELVDVVVPDAPGCQCSGCTLTSTVEGQRKAGSP